MKRSGEAAGRARAADARRPWRGAALGLLLWGVGATDAAAQFSVYPVIVELAPRDTAQTVTITVSNEGREDLQFRFYTGDFEQDSTGEHTFMAAGAHARSCAGRLRVLPDGLVIRGGERQAVRIRMEPGAATCWSLVYAEAAPGAGGAVRISQRIGVKTYGVRAGVARDGEIAAVRAEHGADSVRVTLDVRNTGEAPMRPFGSLEVRTQEGRAVRTVEVEPFSVLPGRQRILHAALPGGLPPGEYLVVPVLDFGGDYLMGGQVPLRVRR